MREVIQQKIVDSLASPVPSLTRRDVRVPAVPRKAVAVIGMRRTGKTTFLWQVLADRLAQGTGREGLLYFNFEDERYYFRHSKAYLFDSRNVQGSSDLTNDTLEVGQVAQTQTSADWAQSSIHHTGT
jgi:hypothetical protein